MKKLLSVLLATVMLLTCIPLGALNISAASYMGLTYSITDGEVTITDCDATWTGELVIPSTIEGNPVTKIGNKAFYNCKKFTSVTIPNSITAIGKSAFAECDALVSITVPGSVEFVNDFAFANCNNLVSVVLDNGVKTIGEEAFSNCVKLKTVTLPNGLTTIGIKAFYSCDVLTSVTIPEGVVRIDNYAFYDCDRILFAIIPDSVTYIGYHVFRDCESLTTAVIGKNVTNIEYCAFRNCDNLTAVVIRNGVTTICGDAFYDCDSLVSITIPASVTQIHGYPFYSCDNLASVTMQGGIDYIGDYAFAECSSLTTITLPDSLTKIYKNAFYNSNKLTDVYYAGAQARWSAVTIEYGNTPLTNATIHYNSSGSETAISINSDFKFLAEYYPEYLTNDLAQYATSNCLEICYDIIKSYDNKSFWLSFAESFVNGSEIILKDIKSELGIGQSVEEEWLQKNTAEYLHLLSDCDGILYEEWNKIEKRYKDFKFSLKGIDTMDDMGLASKRHEFIKAISGRTSCFSEAEAEKFADKLIEKEPSGISKFFSTVDYAVDLADIMMFSMQMLELETSVLKRLQDNIGTDTPLYEGIQSVLDIIEEDPSNWVMEKYLTDQACDKICDFLSDTVDWIAQQFGARDYGLIRKSVKVIASLLYNYVYKGAKIDEIYGATVSYDFYTTVSISLAQKNNEFLQYELNNQVVTDQMLLDYIFIYEAKRAAMLHYTEACIAIDKNGYAGTLENYQSFFDNNGELSFDNYISLCMSQLRADIAAGDVVCQHVNCSWSYDVQPTCTSEGYSVYVCDVCHFSSNTDYVAALGHNYVANNVVIPSCTEQGYTEYACSRCSATYNGLYTSAFGHSYDSDYDVSCNVCGAIRQIDVLTGGQTSISEDVNGLAFRFDVMAAGGQVVNHTEYVGGSAEVIPSMDGQAYKLVRMGAVVTNQSNAVLDLNHVESDLIVNVEGKYLFTFDENTLSFAVRIINIPDGGKDTEVYARPYYVYEKDGEQVVVYGDVVSNSYNAVLNG